MLDDSPSPTHAQISDRARAIWEQAGRPSERDFDIWLQAERELREQVPIGGSPLPTNVDHPLPMSASSASASRTPQSGRVK